MIPPAANNKLVISMDFIDESGESAADVVATYKRLEYADVVEIQGTVVNALHGLGVAQAAKVAS